MGRNIFRTEREGALEGVPLELELAHHLVDEPEVVGPPKIVGRQQGGIEKSDLRRVVEMVGDVVLAKGSVGLCELAVARRGLEIGDPNLKQLKSLPGRFPHL